MSDDFDYDSLLERARDELPEDTGKHERFQIPKPELLYEGKTTVWRNFLDLAEMLERDPSHMVGVLLRELGTAGDIDGRRLVFKGSVNSKKLEERVQAYMDTYVTCSECHKPDTKLVKDGRALILQCAACGAHRPVKTKKIVSQTPESQVREGKILTARVDDVSAKGDGVVRMGDFVIFVPGASKGQEVKFQIEKVVGRNAFTKLVKDS